MEIKLAEISRRLLFRYYPLLLLTTSLFSIFYSLAKFDPEFSGLNRFIHIQSQLLFSYAFMILPLHFFRISRFLSRFFVMAIFMIISVEIGYFYRGLLFGHGPVPFIGKPLDTYIFLQMISGGFFTMWLFFIAEKSIKYEKKLQNEGLKRLSNEKKLIENQLRLLQAQIEPRFLFNTLSGIIELRDVDMEKAKRMQKYFIQYLRATLVKTRVPVTTVEQELKLIRAYLDIFGEAGNGIEAKQMIVTMRPDVAFLDIKMPGLSGMQVARETAGLCRIVFITAYDQYAIDAFENAAIDNILKPATVERLEKTVQRIKAGIADAAPIVDMSTVIEQLRSEINRGNAPGYLKWIKAKVNNAVRLIPVEKVYFFKAANRYTIVMTKKNRKSLSKNPLANWPMNWTLIFFSVFTEGPLLTRII